MSAIAASSVRLQTLSDGTLRIVCDVEPRHAQAAFRLFGSPGTPLALAALKSAKSEPEPEKPKGGILSQWAALRCQEPDFQRWLERTYPTEWQRTTGVDATTHTAAVVRLMCRIVSRAELDNQPHAAERFDQFIRGPWQKFCISTGATA